jgi:hypothetical protein
VNFLRPGLADWYRITSAIFSSLGQSQSLPRVKEWGRRPHLSMERMSKSLWSSLSYHRVIKQKEENCVIQLWLFQLSNDK